MPDAPAQNHNRSTRMSLVAGGKGTSNSGGDEAAERCEEDERVVTAVTKARATKSRTGSDDNVESSHPSPSRAARQPTQVETTRSRTPSVTGLEGTRASQVSLQFVFVAFRVVQGRVSTTMPGNMDDIQ
jgi:hypothetical protein